MQGNSTTAQSEKILVVDDERTTRMAICEALTMAGYEARAVATADEAMHLLTHHYFHVVILDLNLPGKHSGVDVLEVAHQLAPDTAFIVLTAYASADTAITALRSGAYDYLRKPASLNLIFETMQAALQKRQERQRQQEAMRLLQQAMNTLHDGPATAAPTAKQEKIYQAAGITINDLRHQATYENQILDLTPIEYKILAKFVQEPNTTFSFAELAYESHGTEMDEGEARALLRTHVYRLSRKLGDNETSPLQNVRGRGYMLNTETMA